MSKYNDFAYIIKIDNTVEVIKYLGKDKHVNIPSEIDGHSVTRIGDDAFSGCDSLTSITIPDSVTRIGISAFSGCTSLSNITIPNSVTSIGIDTFQNCASLTSIIIPNNVTSIGGYAFSGCIALTSITIPDSVTSIGDYAFRGCSSLTSVTIPDSVTSIGYDAFYGCTSLESVTIGNSVTSIGDYAFSNCTLLTGINVDSNNPSYCSDNGVLFNKDKSELIQYPARKTDKEYIIPDSVTTVGWYAFSGCTSLTDVTIPDSVTSVGVGAFYGCATLTNINVDSNNPSYFSDNGVLFNKDKSKLILYPEGKTDKQYSIPNSVTSIGDNTFNGCISLTSVTIPNSVTSIDDGAFCGCTSLQNIKIKGDVLELGTHIFDGCDSLTITCPKNSNIEKWAKVNGHNVNLTGSKLSNFLSRDDNLNGGVCHAEI